MAEIFVFGSNEQGLHGKGAALYAHQHYGAIKGQGKGLQGNSYAIPTKSTPWKSLSLFDININVAEFLSFASTSPHIFKVTAIGCGHAGYCYEEIAPMFQLARFLQNVYIPVEFAPFCPDCRCILMKY